MPITENNKKIDIVPVDLLRSESETLPQPLNALLTEYKEREIGYNRNPDDNDKIMHDYHFDE